MTDRKEIETIANNINAQVQYRNGQVFSVTEKTGAVWGGNSLRSLIGFAEKYRTA